MRLSMNLELQDIPGQLLLALQPLSENKANIISVVHHRENMTPRGMIPVRLMVEIDPSRIEPVQTKLKESGIEVSGMTVSLGVATQVLLERAGAPDFDDPLDVRRGKIDLVDDGDDFEVVLHGEIEIGEGLGLDPLGGIDQKKDPFARGKGP